jgi:crotonobetaine/carnitine-CoA ligase
MRPTSMIRTIPAFFEAAVEACPSKVWLCYEDSTYTYGEAYDRVTTLAAGLHVRGVGRGTILLATTPNSPEYLFLWLAAMRLGAVLVPVNPVSTPAELAGIAGQTQPQLVVTDEDLLGLVKQCVAGVTTPPEVALVETLFEPSTRGPLPPLQVRPEEPAVMIPTSGTTGRSKLVVQTHRAYVMAGEGFPFWLGLTSEERMMTSLPLFHINAPAYSVLGSMAARASLVLLPRFSGSRFIESARRYGATQFNAIGAMLEILMRRPERPDDARNPLRLCYTGPSPTKERQLEIERRFGLEIVCGYALSESPYGLVWRRGTRPFGTLGSVRQHPVLGRVNEARVTDQGRSVGPGETGELELRNPAIMLGYYRMPEETDRVLAGGWLRTGDLVRDNGDGTYTFVARKKEVIRRRGENVSPTEVEAALEAHSDVMEAAVIGVPSDLSEEEIKAFVVLRSGAPPELGAVRAFTADRLARFKVPRYLEVVRELPHTSTGRIAKHRLPRERTAAEEDFEPAAAPIDTVPDHPQARRGRT